ncbi:LysR family transcriptional regulator [Sphingorhabdus sp. EL138]|uniref:LysR family transcriptional regulator n=1 Tax=Sphingorhabdus sp. EL138 TaxID=2073156 RepID=UPI000D695527|nr:LysR family transcriptional regulator [Sphingorhabdus sp. EL138]
MDDLRLLRHFEAVYRLLSFSSAAEELHLTHSALTKSVKILEESWDVKLFHRTTRTVAPTEAGKRLYPMARDLLSFAEAVKSETQGGEHVLHVVSGPAILDTMIHPAIVRFAKIYPRTRIVAETMPPAQAMEELVQRRIHLLLYHEKTLARLPHFERLRVTNLVSEPYFTVCRPGHDVLQSGRKLEDIVKHDWAIAGFDSHFEASLSRDVQALLREHDFPKYRLLSQAACIDLVGQSDILTSVPESSARPLMAVGKLAGFAHPQQLEFSVSAAVLRNAGSEPTVERFIECLK